MISKSTGLLYGSTVSCRYPYNVVCTLTLRGEGIYTFSTGNAIIPSGEGKKKKKRGIGTVLHVGLH